MVTLTFILQVQNGPGEVQIFQTVNGLKNFIKVYQVSNSSLFKDELENYG